MTLTLDLPTAWIKISNGEFLLELPSCSRATQGREEVWQQEMLNAQSRRVAFLYQLFREHGTAPLIFLQKEFSDEEFCTLLNMTPATYKISQVATMSIQKLITYPFTENSYGTFQNISSTFYNSLSASDIETLTPLFMRCMQKATKKEVLTALQSKQPTAYTPKVTQIRRLAWLTYLEGANVVISDAAYSQNQLILGRNEAQILVSAVENSPNLFKLILKNYQLSEESVTILKSSSKEIDTHSCQIPTPAIMKISLLGLATLSLMAIIFFFDPFSPSNN